VNALMALRSIRERSAQASQSSLLKLHKDLAESGTPDPAKGCLRH
jgi:hypothetical protein